MRQLFIKCAICEMRAAICPSVRRCRQLCAKMPLAPEVPSVEPPLDPPLEPPPHCAVLSAFIDLLENSNEQVLIHDTRRTMKSMLSACLLCFFCSLAACFVALVFLRQAQYTGRKAVGKRQNSRW